MSYRQPTLDDMEPVIPLNLEDAIHDRQAMRKIVRSNLPKYSCEGKRLYEKIQEQKALEANFDPLFD